MLVTNQSKFFVAVLSFIVDVFVVTNMSLLSFIN